MKSKPRGMPISEKEARMIERYYAARGSFWLAKALGRSPQTVQQFAWRNGIDGRILPDNVGTRRMTLNEAEQVTGYSYEWLRQRADREGVLERHGGTARLPAICSVPTSWVKLLAAEREDVSLEREELLAAGWLTVPQAAKYIGIKASALSARLARKSQPDPPMRATRCRAKAGRPMWLLHPQDVEAHRVQLETEERRSRDMVPFKHLAVEFEITHNGLLRHATALGIEPVRLQRKRRAAMLYVSKDDARRLRKRMRERGYPRPEEVNPGG